MFIDLLVDLRHELVSKSEPCRQHGQVGSLRWAVDLDGDTLFYQITSGNQGTPFLLVGDKLLADTVFDFESLLDHGSLVALALRRVGFIDFVGEDGQGAQYGYQKERSEARCAVRTGIPIADQAASSCCRCQVHFPRMLRATSSLWSRTKSLPSASEGIVQVLLWNS